MTLKTLLSALLLSTALTLPGSPALAQGGACLSDYDINTARESQQILSFDEILRRSGIPREDVVGRVQVCDQGGQLFYHVPVLQGGEARIIPLNAETGRP